MDYLLQMEQAPMLLLLCISPWRKEWIDSHHPRVHSCSWFFSFTRYGSKITLMCLKSIWFEIPSQMTGLYSNRFFFQNLDFKESSLLFQALYVSKGYTKLQHFLGQSLREILFFKLVLNQGGQYSRKLNIFSNSVFLLKDSFESLLIFPKT